MSFDARRNAVTLKLGEEPVAAI
jgi:hypothetical protein